jgi:hypothetical protein
VGVSRNSVIPLYLGASLPSSQLSSQHQKASLLTRGSGLTGSLTIINNTPFIAVPGSTNIPVQATQTGVLSKPDSNTTCQRSSWS